MQIVQNLKLLTNGCDQHMQIHEPILYSTVYTGAMYGEMQQSEDCIFQTRCLPENVIQREGTIHDYRYRPV